MTNGSLMKVKSIAECSLGAFCNTFDLHYFRPAVSGLILSGCFRQISLYCFEFGEIYDAVRYYGVNLLVCLDANEKYQSTWY